MKTWKEAHDGILLFPYNLNIKSFQSGYYFLIATNGSLQRTKQRPQQRPQQRTQQRPQQRTQQLGRTMP